MKNTFYTALITLILTLTIFSSAWGQSSCLPDGITFTTQEEIDNFPVNYPGCVEVEGPIIIHGPNIENLNGLNSLVKIYSLLIDSTSLTDLEGLQNLDTIFTTIFPERSLEISNNPLLVNLESISNLKFVNQGVAINNNQNLESIQPLSNTIIYHGFWVNNNALITTITGFNNIQWIHASSNFQIWDNPALEVINGFNGLEIVYGGLQIRGNNQLIEVNGFNALVEAGAILLNGHSLKTIDGFYNFKKCINIIISSKTNIDINAFFAGNSIKSISITADTIEFVQAMTELDTLGDLSLYASFLRSGINFFPQLATLNNLSLYVGHLNDLRGLDSLKMVNGNFEIGNFLLDTTPVRVDSLIGLENLEYVSYLRLFNIVGLQNLEGLNALTKVNTLLQIRDLPDLITLQGLSSLYETRFLVIRECAQLTSLEGLDGLEIIESLLINGNENLSICNTPTICYLMEKYLNLENIDISDNSPNCNSNSEISSLCGLKINFVEINLKTSGDCAIDQNLDFESNLNVEIYSPHLGTIFIRKFTENRISFFAAEGYSYIVKPINKFNYWDLCIDSLVILPNAQDDTLRYNYLIQPLIDCPNLDVTLDLPPIFRGCLITTDVKVGTQNTGTVPAENVLLSVVIPFDLMEVDSVTPSPVAQSGDTLFFTLGDLDVFENSEVLLTLRTRCDTFLLGHTICLEAFAEMDNPCPPDLPLGSIVKTTANCIGNDIVRFTLTNIGDEATTSPHQYFIIEDEVVLMIDTFSLNVMETIDVDVDATGSTFRMEATKLPNGTLTAAALEGCGGLSEGMINAFWLDQGPSNYAIGCRQVNLAYDPNDKLAIPSGVGPMNLLAANRPIEYTIRFQNTGTDTAYRVLLTDVLPPQMEDSSFRPGFASHEYTWEILNDTLEVLFFPIALPDSAASLEGSQGFFTFSMDQKTDLPDGTHIQNTASIIFDFNPPIVTNTVFHTIGKLIVSIDHPQLHSDLWQLHGNPTRELAVFRSPTSIPGKKQFALFDMMGRTIRMDTFDGHEYVFHRGILGSGIYMFRITDTDGRPFTGLIVVAD